MDYQYIKVPNSITLQEFSENDFCLAPSKYSRFIPNSHVTFETLHDLCTESKNKTKINKTHRYSYTEIGDIDVNTGDVLKNEYWGIENPSKNPKKLKKEDIIVSTVRTYRGGVGFVSEELENHVCSPAIMVIRTVKNKISKEYLFAVLRTSFFIEQILGFQNRGMYPRLDKDAMKHILIPIPKDAAIIKYINLLVKVYLEKIRLIKYRHKKILKKIEEELSENQKPATFKFVHPKLSEIELNSRFDATYYSEKHKRLKFQTLNYRNGFDTLDKQGLELKPGPSLEIRLLGTRINSDKYLEGFYRLITPKLILNYGTVKNYEYIGTPIDIPKIKKGDILFGESGTGRTMVYLDEDKNTINNAHAHILRPIENECTMEKAITIRCIMQYYKEVGLIDCISVGGAGGHLSPSYFDRVYIPNFPISKQKEIAKLYHNEKAKYNVNDCTINNFLKTDIAFNEIAGIYELDKTMKIIKERLNQIIDDIVNNKEIEVKFNFT